MPQAVGLVTGALGGPLGGALGSVVSGIAGNIVNSLGSGGGPLGNIVNSLLGSFGGLFNQTGNRPLTDVSQNPCPFSPGNIASSIFNNPAQALQGAFGDLSNIAQNLGSLMTHLFGGMQPQAAAAGGGFGGIDPGFSLPGGGGGPLGIGDSGFTPGGGGGGPLGIGGDPGFTPGGGGGDPIGGMASSAGSLMDQGEALAQQAANTKDPGKQMQLMIQAQQKMQQAQTLANMATQILSAMSSAANKAISAFKVS